MRVLVNRGQQRGTLVVPMLDPPRAGLTKTGQPSSAMSSSTRLRSAMAVAAAVAPSGSGARQSRSRTTT